MEREEKELRREEIHTLTQRGGRGYTEWKGRDFMYVLIFFFFFFLVII